MWGFSTMIARGIRIAALAAAPSEQSNACWASNAQAPVATLSALVDFARVASAERLDPAPHAVFSATPCQLHGTMDTVAHVELADPRVSAQVSYHTGETFIGFGLAPPGQPKPPKYAL